MVKKDPINHMVADMDSVFFFDLLFEMGRSERMLIMCGKDECFCFIWDWRGFSARLS